MESDKDRIQQFVADGNFHAAINIALSAMNECRRSDNQPCVDEFLDVIRRISQTLEREFGSQDNPDTGDVPSCCICGVTEDGAELLSGAKGAICGKCADNASRHFAGKGG